MYEPQPDANGDYFIWLDERTVNQLGALRGPGESYSNVINPAVRRAQHGRGEGRTVAHR